MNPTNAILLLALCLVCLNVVGARRLKRLPARFPKKKHTTRFRSTSVEGSRSFEVYEDSIQDSILSTAELYKLIKISSSSRVDTGKGTTRREKRLYCRVGIGYHLEIKKNGRVVARHQATDDGRLVIFSLKPGVVGIQSEVHNRYLCMNKKGKLITRRSFKSDCSFRERMEGNHFNTYASEKFSKNRKGYFLAISKRGKPKRGRNVSWREKKAHWLPLDYTP